MPPVIRHIIETPHFTNMLHQRLPAVRGRITPNAPIAQYTWFGVGGPAEVLFRPADPDDLAAFLAACPADVPVTVMGVASNLIIRDGGIPGVVVRLGREFAGIHADSTDHTVTAGAAALDMNVALAAAQAGIAGVEFLSGIPGSIGGGLRMNAGAYGREFKDVLISADILTRAGEKKTLTPAQMGMSYRRTTVDADAIFLAAHLQGTPGETGAIEARMMEIKQARAESQPIRTKTGGSTFANPSAAEDPQGRRAWQLVDAAGCRGLIVGGAQMSEMHCNFMLNNNGATAADLERLGEEVRRRVAEKTGVMLRWEVKRIGIPLAQDKDIQDFIAQNTAG